MDVFLEFGWYFHVLKQIIVEVMNRLKAFCLCFVWGGELFIVVLLKVFIFIWKFYSDLAQFLIRYFDQGRKGELGLVGAKFHPFSHIHEYLKYHHMEAKSYRFNVLQIVLRTWVVDEQFFSPEGILRLFFETCIIEKNRAKKAIEEG